MALLSFRATPIPWCLFSPTELLMGRKLRTDIPIAKTLLTPQWSYLPEFRESTRLNRSRTMTSAIEPRTLDPLFPDTPVWITTGNDRTPGQIRSPAATPRSYIVSTPSGELRRTRRHVTPRSPVMTHSRSGIAVRPPDRMMLKGEM